MTKGKSFISPLAMDDLGLEEEVEINFDGTPPAFPRENHPPDSLGQQTVSFFYSMGGGVKFVSICRKDAFKFNVYRNIKLTK